MSVYLSAIYTIMSLRNKILFLELMYELFPKEFDLVGGKKSFPVSPRAFVYIFTYYKIELSFLLFKN